MAQASVLYDREAPDLLHMGNLDGAILHDLDQARHTYNDQLVLYNGKFAQLVGKLHANVDGISKIVAELPYTEELNVMQQKIYTFN